MVEKGGISSSSYKTIVRIPPHLHHPLIWLSRYDNTHVAPQAYPQVTREGRAREGRSAGRGGGRDAGRGGGRAGRRGGRELEGAHRGTRYLPAAQPTPNTSMPSPALPLGNT